MGYCGSFMRLFKRFSTPLILIACLGFLVLALSISGRRLWANIILWRTGDAVQAADAAPFDRTALFFAGNIWMVRNNCPEAIRTYGILTRLYPHYWDARNNLAICLAVMGESQKAERHWEEVLREWPWHEAAKKNLQEIQKKSRPGK